ncbi:MAG: iron-containing alcohol dehydrogenase, partial [Elusimicrobiota bacterium]|nr:iron-containing alcohol dehydrogenase [Elusimicrobiota bacterium]
MKISNLPAKVIQCTTAGIAGALKDEGKRCLMIGPPKVHDIYGEQIDAALGKRAKIYAGFNGECCKTEIARLVSRVRNHKSDFIFVFGGGKAMDTAKSVAAQTGRRLVALPTSAATCASFTSHSVIYGEKGNFLEEDRHFKCPDTLILADEILESAPKRLLFSGIADACAKYYEFTFNAGRAKDNSMFEYTCDMLKRFFTEAGTIKRSSGRTAVISLSRLCIVNTGLISA